jgi:hypothetical protein
LAPVSESITTTLKLSYIKYTLEAHTWQKVSKMISLLIYIVIMGASFFVRSPESLKNEKKDMVKI